MTWWESAAHAESSTAPFAGGFDVPESLSPADLCHECHGLHCHPWCSRYSAPPPIADSIERIRELQQPAHYPVRVKAGDKYAAVQVLCIRCRTDWPCGRAA